MMRRADPACAGGFNALSVSAEAWRVWTPNTFSAIMPPLKSPSRVWLTRNLSCRPVLPRVAR